MGEARGHEGNGYRGEKSHSLGGVRNEGGVRSRWGRGERGRHVPSEEGATQGLLVVSEVCVCVLVA